MVTYLLFATNLEKNISTPENQLFNQTKKEEKNEEKKNLLQSYTPCLNSQSVKMMRGQFIQHINENRASFDNLGLRASDSRITVDP